MPDLKQKAVKALTESNNQDAEILLRACVNSNDVDADTYNLLAVCLKRLERIDESVEYIERALELSRAWPVLANYCNIMRIAGLLDKSIEAGKEAACLHESSTIYSNLGFAYMAAGDREAALSSAQAGEALDPQDKNILRLMYEVLTCKGNLNDAQKYIEKAYALYPDDAEVRASYGSFLIIQGRAQEAVGLYTEIDMPEIENSSLVMSNYISLMCATGETNEAVEKLTQLIKAGKHSATSHKLLMGLVDYRSPEYSWLRKDLLGDNFKRYAESGSHKVELAAARFGCYHRSGDYGEASKQLTLKLKLQSKLVNPQKAYEIFVDKTESEKDALKSFLPLATEIRRRCREDARIDWTPIFIVGLPRCGSTLLETILSLNPSCCDLGESRAYQEAKAFAEEQGEISLDDVSLIKKNYKQFTASHAKRVKAGSPKFFTNKMLYNFMYLGSIQLFIPEAKIIVCKRHPLDHLISIAREVFASANDWAGSIEEIAKAIVLYHDTISFYKSSELGGELIEYDYDAFVTEPRRELRQILSALGIEWEEKYLHPESSSRSIATASVNQARKPISSASLGTWKHYERILEPAKRIFDEHNIAY